MLTMMMRQQNLSKGLWRGIVATIGSNHRKCVTQATAANKVLQMVLSTLRATPLIELEH
jgi:hypothetical protein